MYVCGGPVTGPLAAPVATIFSFQINVFAENVHTLLQYIQTFPFNAVLKINTMDAREMFYNISAVNNVV